MRGYGQSWTGYFSAAVLLGSLAVALWLGNWSLAFVALVALVAALAPIVIESIGGIKLPPLFLSAVIAFVLGTLFLGELLDFYNRFWWWDLALHGGSALGFGMIGFVVIFMMFQRDRYAAPPFGIAVFAFCFAVTIGAVWEVFEFAMDQFFGLNMQKSGLPDTMGDLIVNMIGAAVGAGAGWAYLKRRDKPKWGLARILEEFIDRNPGLFARLQDPDRSDPRARVTRLNEPADTPADTGKH